MIDSENGSRLDVDLKGEVYEGCRPDTQMTLEAEPANTSHRDRSFEPSSRWSLPRQVSDNATYRDLMPTSYVWFHNLLIWRFNQKQKNNPKVEAVQI
jgi:hypothetical protein